MKLEDEVVDNMCTTRRLMVTRLGDNNGTTPGRIVQQFHYTTWPDFGAPKSPGDFLDLLQRVRDSGVLDNDVGPAVVHCSAGIGRSGTFCLVDVCLLALAAGRDDVSVKETLISMRHYRMGLVQTPDQYRFAFLAILRGVYDARFVPQGEPNPDSTSSPVVPRKAAGEEKTTLEVENRNGVALMAPLAVIDEDITLDSSFEQDASPEAAAAPQPKVLLVQSARDGEQSSEDSEEDDDGEEEQSQEDKSDLKRPSTMERERETESPAKQLKTASNGL